MQPRQFIWGTCLLTVAGLGVPLALSAQEPAEKAEVEALARGPVHEGYAIPVDGQPGPGPIVPKQPPEPIEELPPDQKPEGKDVQWIPGYWGWDEERKDFIWVSGFWRVPPPDRVWVPGSWRQIGDGWQWVGGFWAPANAPVENGAVDPQAAPQQPQAELQYLPEPPASLDAGPVTPAPSEDSIYVPGNWMYQDRYVWRPGYWIECRPDWVWVNAHYRWTPAGHVFINGYWDYPLANRGVLFSPVFIPPPLYSAPNFVYTPNFVVQEDCMYGALFVRRGWGQYYFGDYFGQQYASVGFTPWVGSHFNLGINVGRGFHDPLFSHYRTAYRNDPFWNGGIGSLYWGRHRGTIAPPPRTLIQQNTVVNNIVNNTTINNIAVNNRLSNNVTMLSPLSSIQRNNRALQQVAPDARQQFAREATQIRQVAQVRRQAEAQLVARTPQGPRQTAPQPQSIRLPVPQQAVVRAQSPSPRPTGPNAAPRVDRPAAPPRPIANPVQNPRVQSNPASRPQPSPAAQPQRPISQPPRANPVPQAQAQTPRPAAQPTPIRPQATPATQTQPPRPAAQPQRPISQPPRANPVPQNQPPRPAAQPTPIRPQATPIPQNQPPRPAAQPQRPIAQPPRANPVPQAQTPRPAAQPTPIRPQATPSVQPQRPIAQPPRANPVPQNQPPRPAAQPTPLRVPQAQPSRPAAQPTPIPRQAAPAQAPRPAAQTIRPQATPAPQLPRPAAQPIRPQSNPIPRAQPVRPQSAPAPRPSPVPQARPNVRPAAPDSAAGSSPGCSACSPASAATARDSVRAASATPSQPGRSTASCTRTADRQSASRSRATAEPGRQEEVIEKRLAAEVTESTERTKRVYNPFFVSRCSL